MTSGRIEAACRSLGGSGCAATAEGARPPWIAGRLPATLAALAAGAATMTLAGVELGLLAAAPTGVPAGLPPLVAATALAAAATLAAGFAVVRLPSAAPAPDAASGALAAAADGEGLALHAADGTVVAVAPAAERMTGVRAAGLLGDALLGRVLPGDRPAYLRALAATVETGDPRVATVGFVTGGDGLEALDGPGRRVFDVRFEPWREGVLARFACAAARLSAAAEIERLAAALAAQEGLRERLVATLCHEIGTPLNAVLGFADTLGEAARAGRCPTARTVEYAGLIGEAGRHLLSVTTDLLDAARLGGEAEHAPEETDLAAIADRCRKMMAPAAEAAGLVLDLVVAPGLPPVHADPRACRQILLNLVSNAVKFTDRGGDVVIRLERDGGRVRLSVRDTGIGIAPEAIGRLGTPYLRLEAAGRRRDGAGLGLAVVKALAALHGGRLDIRSRPGHGTTAGVDLPVAGETAMPQRVSDGRSAG